MNITYMYHERLPHVLWIRGPARAGKTTVARRRHGLRWYNCDAQAWQHLDRAVAGGVRNAQRFAALTPAQRAIARLAEVASTALATRPATSPAHIDSRRPSM